MSERHLHWIPLDHIKPGGPVGRDCPSCLAREERIAELEAERDMLKTTPSTQAFAEIAKRADEAESRLGETTDVLEDLTEWIEWKNGSPVPEGDFPALDIAKRIAALARGEKGASESWGEK